jgi:hypothetical protein
MGSPFEGARRDVVGGPAVTGQLHDAALVGVGEGSDGAGEPVGGLAARRGVHGLVLGDAGEVGIEAGETLGTFVLDPAGHVALGGHLGAQVVAAREAGARHHGGVPLAFGVAPEAVEHAERPPERVLHDVVAVRVPHGHAGVLRQPERPDHVPHARHRSSDQHVGLLRRPPGFAGLSRGADAAQQLRDREVSQLVHWVRVAWGRGFLTRIVSGARRAADKGV